LTEVVETAVYNIAVKGLQDIQNADALLAKLAVSEERVTQGTRTHADGVDRLIARYSAQARAENDLIKSLETLARYEQEGISTEEKRGQAALLATQRYNEQVATLGKHTTAVNDNSKAAGAAVVSAGQLRFAVQNLGFQLNDIATSLASGGSPMRVLAQQAGQVQQAFQQGGGPSAVLRGFGSSIASLITPTTAAVAGVVALAGGVLLLGGRASETEARLRTFNVILKGMGDSGDATAEGLDQVVKGLRNTGTAAEDALKAVQAFARVPGINRGSAATLLPLARDIGAVNGQDIATLGTRMATAFAQGTDAAIKLAFELAGPNGLSVAQAASARAFDAQGNRAAAAIVIIDALKKRFDGSFQNSLSDSAKSINSIGAAWSNMLDKLSDTKAVGFARDAVIGMLNGIAKAAAGGGSTATAATVRPDGTPQSPAPAGFKRDVTGRLIRDFNQPEAGMAPDLAIGGALTGPITPELIRSMIRVESGGNPNLTSPAGASGLMGLRPGTARSLGVSDVFNPTENVNAGIKYITELVQKFGLEGGLAAYNMGPGNYQKFLDGIKPMPLETQKYVPNVLAGAGVSFGSGTFRNIPGGGGNVLPRVSVDANSPVPAEASNENLANLDKWRESQEKINKALAETGERAIYAKTYADSLASSALSGNEKEWEAQLRASDAVEKFRIELKKASDTQDLTTQGIIKTAAAYQQGLVPGLKSAAEEQAKLDVRLGNATDVGARTQQLLKASAAAAIDSAAKAIPELAKQAEASEKLAAAAKNGTGAQHEAELQNQATAATHNALAAAEATGNGALIAQAKALTESTLAQIKKNDAAQTALLLQQGINSNNNQIEILKLETSLQGQTTEEISRQVALLQAKQLLQSKNVDLASDEAKQYLASTDQLERAKIALAETQRSAQALNDVFRSIGETIATSITDAITGLFDKKKVVDWGTQIKTVVSGLASQLISGGLVRPAIGSVLSGLGLGAAAQNFGTLGGTFNAISNIGGGGSSGTGASGSSGGIGNVLQGGGLLKDLFGIDLGSGGIGGAFNSFGAKLGFATGPNTATGVDIPGSLFGNTTLGGFAGGVGAGFGAGSLLNRLIGGNSVGGTIGSGLGSLAGAGIGSLFGGPLIGGLLGGVLGGPLGGLFGGNRKPDNASGGVINLATGGISNVQSGGNPQNDQTASQIGTALAATVTRALQIPGAQLPGGAVGIQAGTRDGIKLSFGGQEQTFKDATSAIAFGLNALRDNLTGVSDTVQKVLHSIGDPAQVEAALAFADTYDRLKDAAASAFSEVEKGTNTIGPFETAMSQINAQFQALKDGATQYGLSLDPVIAAQDEATKRLRQDFSDAVDLYTGNDTTNAIKTILDNYKAITREASAVGATDKATGDRLGNTFLGQAGAALSTLGPDQLREVQARFGGLNSGLDEMTKALIAAGGGAQYVADAAQKAADEQVAAAKAIADAGTQLAQQMKPLQDLVAELTTGKSSGLTIAAQVNAANDNFQRELSLVRGGNLDETGNLATAGQNAVTLSQQAYGNSAKTAQLRASIVQGVDSVLKGKGFAEGGDPDPGWNLVGERGPEWLHLPGGSMVLPNGTSVGGSSSMEVAGLLREVIGLLKGNNAINREHGAVSERGFEKVTDALSAPPKIIEAPPRKKVA